ncbi:MAG: hypothetical protein BWX80_02999 [Candidatus Hydrogenedentes bacterium ADurb.Bin101]|nr:MAG: hypothetical protein BWX80_02999 [Candidatus Hydrogenedentes bacterium ADurb.Bin101]
MRPGEEARGRFVGVAQKNYQRVCCLPKTYLFVGNSSFLKDIL